MLICSRLNADNITPEQVRSAVARIVPWLEKGASGSSSENKCFTCHNHALPILALVEAKQHGFDVDAANLAAQLEHTETHLKRGKERYLQAKGQGGGVLTAGYALWSLRAGDVAANETTSAVASFLLQHQSNKDHWSKQGKRPPSDGNEFTATYVALKGLESYCRDTDSAAKVERFKKVSEWLTNTQPLDTEDSVFRLKALKLVEADKTDIQRAIDALLTQQRSDGGWAQMADMDSDVYATSTVMAALLDEGDMTDESEVIRKGTRYLIESQLEDGTWHVTSRADGFQPYYETGFPHDEDQYISIAASSWATLALLRTLPASDE